MDLEWNEIKVKRKLDSNEIHGLDELETIGDRYAYVIETPNDMTIRYQEGASNVCYIGRQGIRKRGSRALWHGKGWIARLLILAQSENAFSIHYCHPRRRNMPLAYADVEASLINSFTDKFGSPPLFNKKQERRSGAHEINLNAPFMRRRSMDTVFQIDARQKIEPEVEEQD